MCKSWQLLPLRTQFSVFRKVAHKNHCSRKTWSAEKTWLFIVGKVWMLQPSLTLEALLLTDCLDLGRISSVGGLHLTSTQGSRLIQILIFSGMSSVCSGWGSETLCYTTSVSLFEESCASNVYWCSIYSSYTNLELRAYNTNTCMHMYKCMSFSSTFQWGLRLDWMCDNTPKQWVLCNRALHYVG